jgi:uncharacterized protein (TIGR02246 family)
MRYATAVGLVLLASPTLAAEHSQADAQKAVSAFVEHYVNLYNAKNARGIAELFADDGVEVPPAPISTGRDNIEKWFESILTRGATGLKYDVLQVVPAGDYVFAVGNYSAQLPKPKGDGMQEVSGHFVNVYEWAGNDLKYRVHSYNFVPPTSQ